MRELKALGMRPFEIAAAVNVNRATVYRILKEVAGGDAAQS
jgi:DNA invertase Pin-like site-specific DNA recombinase